jgi:hypothetical protein
MGEASPVSELGGLVGDFFSAIFLLLIAPFLPDAKI